MTPVGEKNCVICGEDCAGKPRVKDPKGRYYCRSCYEKAQARQADLRQSQERASSRPDAPPAFNDGDKGPFGKSLLDDIDLEDDALTGGEKENAVAGNCPGCGASLPEGAVLCVQCGFNLQTGQAVTPSIETGEESDEQDADDQAAENAPEHTTWPTIIGIITMLFGGIFLLSALFQSMLAALTIANPMDVVGIVMGMLLVAAVWIWPVWGGFNLFRRRPGSVMMLRIWSIVMIIIVGSCLAVLGISIPFAGEWIAELTGEVAEETDLALGELAIGIMLAIVMALALALLAWPTFLLIWLRRTIVKAEVARWAQGGAS